MGSLATERGVAQAAGRAASENSLEALEPIDTISIEPIPETDLNLNENESMSRFVAYASPYLFWATVLGLSAGLLLLQ